MYDEETGFYYLRSRYYDPSVGRFLNADGLVSTGIGFDGNNMFAYCNNNPVMFVDPNGTSSTFIASNIFAGPLWIKQIIAETILKSMSSANESQPTNPITNGEITQGYHDNHKAFDIKPIESDIIYAAYSGKVVEYVNTYPNDFRSYDDSKMESYGNYVIIETIIDGKKYHMMYAHMQYGSSFFINQIIYAGNSIGRAGSTGRTVAADGGPFIHLHFEVITWDEYGNKIRVNPTEFLSSAN